MTYEAEIAALRAFCAVGFAGLRQVREAGHPVMPASVAEELRWRAGEPEGA